MTQMTSEMWSIFSILFIELISRAKVCIIEILEYGQDDQLCELVR
jgi:hypothetical protein